MQVWDISIGCCVKMNPLFPCFWQICWKTTQSSWSVDAHPLLSGARVRFSLSDLVEILLTFTLWVTGSLYLSVQLDVFYLTFLKWWVSTGSPLLLSNVWHIHPYSSGSIPVLWACGLSREECLHLKGSTGLSCSSLEARMATRDVM